MKICGIQKTTLLDYPGKVACTIFIGGCNFLCPYCHNSELIDGSAPAVMSEEELFSFLKKRRGVLDAVCVSGGEPTLAPELRGLLSGIKSMGYSVKLDTNGCRPKVIKELSAAGLIDYIAMDIKDSPAGYFRSAGRDVDIDRIRESAAFLMSGAVDYEFRTTVVAELHNDDTFYGIVNMLLSLSGGAHAERYFLQPFADRDTVAFSGLHAPPEEALLRWRNILCAAAKKVEIRG